MYAYVYIHIYFYFYERERENKNENVYPGRESAHSPFFVLSILCMLYVTEVICKCKLIGGR